MVEQGCQRWFSGCNLCLLSFCYRHGLGVEKEPFGKLKWLKKSAILCNESAMSILVHWYDKSLGITADTKLGGKRIKRMRIKKIRKRQITLVRFVSSKKWDRSGLLAKKGG